VDLSSTLSLVSLLGIHVCVCMWAIVFLSLCVRVRSVEQLLPLLRIMAPVNEQFTRLKEFIEMKLPKGGFPVSLQIPLWWSLRAVVTFKNFRVVENGPGAEASVSAFNQDLFDIPHSFTKKAAVLQNIYGRCSCVCCAVRVVSA
jgi:GPCR-chaperone